MKHSHQYREQQQNHRSNHRNHRYYSQDRYRRFQKSSDRDELAQYDGIDNNKRIEDEAVASSKGNFKQYDDGHSHLDRKHQHMHMRHGHPDYYHHYKHNQFMTIPSQEVTANDNFDQLCNHTSGRPQNSNSPQSAVSTNQDEPYDQIIETTDNTALPSHHNDSRLSLSDNQIAAQALSQMDYNHIPNRLHDNSRKAKRDQNYKSDKFQRSNESKRNDRVTNRNNGLGRHKGKGRDQFSPKEASKNSSHYHQRSKNQSNKSDFMDQDLTKVINESAHIKHQNKHPQLSNETARYSKNTRSTEESWRSFNSNNKINSNKAFKGSVRYLKVP